MTKKHTPEIKNSLLENIEIYSDYLVQPLKSEGNGRMNNIYTGIILKIPKKTMTDYLSGDEWKALVSAKTEFMVGDKVLYTNHCGIVLYGKILHLVPWLVGRILK